MAIKVIAQRRVLKIGKNPGVKKFVMRPELYTPIQEKKDAAGEVIKAWATEGHSVPLPGLGTMRFSVRSKAVESLEDVKTGLISTRRIVFTPSVDVKEELQDTSIQITCLDEDGTVLKRVTSDDEGIVEDNDNVNDNVNNGGNGNDNGNGNPNPNQGGEDED